MPRPFAYNPSKTPISGCTQEGDMAIGVSEQDYSSNIGGLQWFNGPDETSGYVIAMPFSAGTFTTADGDDDGTVHFFRSTEKTQESLLELVKVLSNGDVTNDSEMQTWLGNEGFWFDSIYWESQSFQITVDTTQTGSTSSAINTFILPFYNEIVDFNVDWGDGNSENVTGSTITSKTHIYDTGGTYQISISGDFPGVFFNNGGDKAKLISVDNWGNITWSSMDSAFYGCYNMTSLSTYEIPDTSNVVTFKSIFDGCSSLVNVDLRGWNTSNVTNLIYAFYECTNLEVLNINNWDISNVTNLGYAFINCTSLTTLDVSNWVTSNVSLFEYAFFGCVSLTTLDVSNWDMSSVTNLEGTFEACTGLTTLNTSNWILSSATTLESCFSECLNLTTLDTSNWELSSAENMYFTFYNCIGLTTLNTSNWITSGITSLWGTFHSCSGLTTLDVSNWDTSNVSDFDSFASGCTNLKGDFSALDISSASYLDNMFNGCDINETGSTTNYDNLLISFDSQTVQNGLSFHGGNSIYSSTGEVARDSLINNDGWTINDGGIIPSLIYAVGVDSIRTNSDGIYVFDNEGNYLDEFHQLIPIYNSGSEGEIVPPADEGSPRDIGIDVNTGKIYIIDIGYGNRLYRLNSDLTIDETFIAPDHYYLTLTSYMDFPESVEIDDDSNFYIGDRNHEVHKFTSGGTFVETYNLSGQTTNNLIGAIRILNDKYYVTDKDTIYEYDSTWNYTDNHWSTTFTVSGSTHGADLYGLTKTNNGWLSNEVIYDEIIEYDNNFELVNYLSHNSVVSSIRGLISIPAIRTGTAPEGITVSSGRTFFVDFGRIGNQTSGNWNNIIDVGGSISPLIDSSGNTSSISLDITVPFKSDDYGGGGSWVGFPDSAIDDSFVVRAYENTNSVIELTGLTSAKTYNVKLYATQNVASTTDFWINGVKQTIDNFDNTTEIALYSNISPDANDKIIIEVNTDTNYGYLNVMVLEEN